MKRLTLSLFISLFLFNSFALCGEKKKQIYFYNFPTQFHSKLDWTSAEKNEPGFVKISKKEKNDEITYICNYPEYVSINDGFLTFSVKLKVNARHPDWTNFQERIFDYSFHASPSPDKKNEFRGHVDIVETVNNLRGTNKNRAPHKRTLNMWAKVDNGFILGTYFVPPSPGSYTGPLGEFRFPLNRTVINDGEVDAVTVFIDREGYEKFETVHETEKKVSEIELSGTVRDSSGNPLPKTEIFFMEYDEKTVTDAFGQFSVLIELDRGIEPWKLVDNIVLEPEIKGLSVKVIPDKPLIANGKPQWATLVIKAGDKSLSNRKVYIGFDYDKIEDINGRSIREWMGKSEQALNFKPMYTTDRDGKVHLQIPTPVWKDKKVPIPEDSDREIFPISSVISLQDLETQKSCTARFETGSPFPVIKRITVPPTHAGDFQGSPGSRIVVEDPDSAIFEISITAAGELKVEGDKGVYDENITKMIKGKELKFLYRPPGELSEDITTLPNLGREMAKATGKVVLEHYTEKITQETVSRISLASKYRLKAQQGMYTLRDSDNLVSMGVTGVKGVKQAMDLQKLSYDTGYGIEMGTLEKRDTATGYLDQAFGVVDSINNFTNTPLGDTSLPYKVAYENAKALYKVHRENEKIAHSYSESFMSTFRFIVEDSDGHRVFAIRKAPMYAYRKGE